MNWKNRDLVVIESRFDVDTSALTERLDDIDQKLEEISGVTEDKVTTLIEDYVGSNDYQTADDVASYIDGEGYVKGDDIDDRIADYARVNSLMDSSDVDSAIDARMEDYTTASDVRDIITEMGLDTDSVADADEVDGIKADVETIKRDVADLTRRFEMYATRVDDLMQNNHTLNEAVVRTEQRLDVLAERNSTALDFFGLIQQAFNLLKRGA